MKKYQKPAMCVVKIGQTKFICNSDDPEPGGGGGARAQRDNWFDED